jgi:hypothetical protein
MLGTVLDDLCQTIQTCGDTSPQRHLGHHVGIPVTHAEPMP